VEKNNTENTLLEAHKLVEIVVTTPVSSAKSESFFFYSKKSDYLPQELHGTKMSQCSGHSEYPQGCNWRHSEDKPVSNTVVLHLRKINEGSIFINKARFNKVKTTF
jgi:hypothetical protein